MMYPLRCGRSEPKVGRGGDSSEVEAESEPWVGRGGDRLPRSRLSLSPGVGRA
jgi:hypothetical protein